MSVRIRFILFILLVGLIPMGILGAMGFQTMRQMDTRAVEAASDTLRKARLNALEETAQSVAGQIEVYLNTHPNIDPTDSQALMASPDLALIAVQPVKERGTTLVFNSDAVWLFALDPQYVGMDIHTLPVNLSKFKQRLLDAINGNPNTGDYDWYGADGERVHRTIAFAQVGSTGLFVAATVDNSILYATYPQINQSYEDSKRNTYQAFSFVLGFAVVLAIGGAVLVGRELSAQIVILSESTAKAIGTFTEAVPIPPKSNELEALHHSFTEMMRLTREYRTNLDKQVKLRTADLGRRTAQIETAAQIALEAAEIKDISKLLEDTPRLIAERFAFYHIGIFIIDAAREYAVLQASNSEGGKRMLDRGHRIAIGQTGIVSTVAESGEPLVVPDVNLTDIHVTNPDLPRTRSEMAIPLKVHNTVLGVMDIQSTEPNVFGQDDLKILTILAEQIALAIQNTRLLEESQRSLRELNALYGQQSREAWRQRVGQKLMAYNFSPLGVTDASQRVSGSQPHPTVHKPEIIIDDSGSKLVVPLLLRGQPLGAITLQREAHEEQWSDDDLSMMNELAGQIANALESARLMETVQRLAQQERQIGMIAAKTQSSLDLETVIKTAVQEIGAALNAERVQIRLTELETTKTQTGNGDKPQRN